MQQEVQALKEGTICNYNSRSVEVCDRSLRYFGPMEQDVLQVPENRSPIEVGLRLKYADGKGIYVPLCTKVEVL